MTTRKQRVADERRQCELKFHQAFIEQLASLNARLKSKQIDFRGYIRSLCHAYYLINDQLLPAGFEGLASDRDTVAYLLTYAGRMVRRQMFREAITNPTPEVIEAYKILLTYPDAETDLLEVKLAQADGRSIYQSLTNEFKIKLAS